MIILGFIVGIIGFLICVANNARAQTLAFAEVFVKGL